MSSYSHAMRICATCTRWGGIREVGLNVPAYFVDVEDSRLKGECYGGGFRMLEMLPTASCGKHEKWLVLK